jgi:hypothetical protein
MDMERCGRILTRRGVLTIAAGAGFTSWTRLYGSNSDFWNKKEPADWSSAEVEQMITKSPWAKETTAQYSRDQSDGGGYPGGGNDPNAGGYPPGGGGYPGGGGGGGYPGGGIGGGGRGGMGIPGMGGGGMGGGRGGRRGGQQMELPKGTVRWESSKPVLEAMKTPLPDAFAKHYVISVSGFPLNGGRYRRSQDDSDTSNSDSNASQSTDDMLDRLKSLSFLAPKGRDGAQPGIVQKSPTGSGGTLLFGFSQEMLSLKPDDKEATFSTKLGSLVIKTKFNLKDMMYKGELAL